MSIAFKVQGGTLVRDFPRLDAELIASFRGIPTSILSDCLDRMNVMSSALRPLLSGKAFVGSAFTVEEIEAGNLMSHLALKYVQAGDVLVIDGKGVTSRAGWGGLQTFAASRKGVAAVVIDGAIRDADDIPRYGVSVYCRGVSPAGPHKGWGGRVNLPISCGGMIVSPGDLIVGDGDGIVVVPFERAERTLAQAQQKMATEAEWFQQVEQGVDTSDFLGFEETAKKFGIEII